jgi:hypothetical protein
MSRKVVSLQELQYYVFLLEDTYEEVFNYKQLQDLLLKDFGITAELTELQKLDEPTLEEEVEDLRLILNNNGY